MYFGHIYQLNSEPGRGRRGQIGFASAAVELGAAVERGAAVELFSSPAVRRFSRTIGAFLWYRVSRFDSLAPT